MAEATTNAGAIKNGKPKKSSRIVLILALVLSLIGAGGGFIALYSGFFSFGAESSSGETSSGSEEESLIVPVSEVSFIRVDEIVIGIGGADRRFLTFQIDLEVPRTYAAEVEAMMPRIINTLNTYLRATEVEEFEKSGALPALRAQLLRRLQVITGPGRIQDILIQRFVVN